VPRGFVGVMADGPLVNGDSGVSLAHEMRLMKDSGVQTVRLTFSWAAAQPYARAEDVPEPSRGSFTERVAGVPTDFSATDRLVRTAAAHGLRVLPVVLYSPRWAAKHPNRAISPPARPGTFGRFLGALVRRYGSRGRFWQEHPALHRVPLLDWQIWNEPNIPHYWPQPFARGYVKLLRAARAPLKRADPRARLVLAGLTNDSWNALARIYRAGGRRYFDVAALHPYTRKVNGLVKILAFARYWMRRFHDGRKPIAVTELSWPSSADKVHRIGFNEVTEQQQARRVAAAYKLLAKHRKHFRIAGVYWYTWLSMDRGDYYFDYSGLRKMTRDGIRSKPAFGAFKRVARRLRRAR
jgi:hypothetical protein